MELPIGQIIRVLWLCFGLYWLWGWRQVKSARRSEPALPRLLKYWLPLAIAVLLLAGSDEWYAGSWLGQHLLVGLCQISNLWFPSWLSRVINHVLRLLFFASFFQDVFSQAGYRDVTDYFAVVAQNVVVAAGNPADNNGVKGAGRGPTTHGAR